jgi:hypothetical protein
VAVRAVVKCVPWRFPSCPTVQAVKTHHNVSATRMHTAADHRPPLAGTAPDSLSGPRGTCGEQSDMGQCFPWRTILILQPAKLFAFVIMSIMDVRASRLLVLGCLQRTAALTGSITWPVNITSSAEFSASRASITLPLLLLLLLLPQLSFHSVLRGQGTRVATHTQRSAVVFCGGVGKLLAFGGIKIGIP